MRLGVRQLHEQRVPPGGPHHHRGRRGRHANAPTLDAGLFERVAHPAREPGRARGVAVQAQRTGGDRDARTVHRVHGALDGERQERRTTASSSQTTAFGSLRGTSVPSGV